MELALGLVGLVAGWVVAYLQLAQPRLVMELESDCLILMAEVEAYRLELAVAQEQLSELRSQLELVLEKELALLMDSTVESVMGLRLVQETGKE